MMNHADEARALLQRAQVNADCAEALADSTAAVAHATLALAEEQRTANLQAYMDSTQRARERAGSMRNASEAAVVDDWIGEQMAIIRERLGLER